MNELLRSRRTTGTNDKLQTPIISKGTQQEQIPVDTDKGNLFFSFNRVKNYLIHI